MGWTDDAANSLSDGLKSAERALSLDEKDPLAYVAAARVHMMQGNHDDSIAAIRTALGINPSFALALSQSRHGLDAVRSAGRRYRRVAPVGTSESDGPDPLGVNCGPLAGLHSWT